MEKSPKKLISYNVKLTDKQNEFLELAAKDMTKKINADIAISKSAIIRHAINLYMDWHTSEDRDKASLEHG